MILFFAVCYTLIHREKRRSVFWLLPIFITALIGALCNALAPGTWIRAQHLKYKPSLVEALAKSIMRTGLEAPRWLDVPLLCLFLLLTPLLWEIVQNMQPDLRLFRHPGRVLALDLFALWAMILLPSVTLGGNGDGRMLNIIWMTFVLGLIAAYTAFLGWLVHVRKIDFTPVLRFLKGQGKRLHLAALAMILCIFCIGGHTIKEGRENMFATSLEAMFELGRGYPQRFAQAWDDWEHTIETAEEEPVVLHTWDIPEDDRPQMLCDELMGPGSEKVLVAYYGKEIIIE